MPILTHETATDSTAADRLRRTLWLWLALGALAVALLPAARGMSPWLGAWPFWLVVVPAIGLLTLHRQVLAAAWRSRRGRPAPRRRRSAAVRTGRPTRGVFTSVRAGVVPQRQALR